VLISLLSCRKDTSENSPLTFSPSITLIFESDTINLRSYSGYTVADQSEDLYFYKLSAEEPITGRHFQLEYYGGAPSANSAWYTIQSISFSRADTTYFNYKNDGSVAILDGSFDRFISGAFGAGIYKDSTGSHYRITGNFSFLRQQ